MRLAVILSTPLDKGPSIELIIHYFRTPAARGGAKIMEKPGKPVTSEPHWDLWFSTFLRRLFASSPASILFRSRQGMPDNHEPSGGGGKDLIKSVLD